MKKYQDAINILRQEPGSQYEEIGDLFQGLLHQIDSDPPQQEFKRCGSDDPRAARAWYYRGGFSPAIEDAE